MTLDNPVEKKLISELMESTDIRCTYLNNNHVYYCSSIILQNRRPDHSTEEQWGMCPFYRLEAWCTKKPETCSFYQK